MVWLPSCVQVPGVLGTTEGRERPRADLIGLEKVNTIGVWGWMVFPGAGLATAEVAAPAGNQLATWAGAVSHLRGTPEIQTEPATAVRSSVTTLVAAGR